MFTRKQQRETKCEWRVGRLDEFVSRYNRENGTSYAHTECLDIKPTGGKTAPKPEVLVTDASGRRMVIERKKVVWPTFFLLRAQNEQDFANIIWQRTHGLFQDRCYVLTVLTKELENLDKYAVQKVASEIGSALVGSNPNSLPLLGSTPIHWCFREADISEYANRKGIVVLWQKSMTLEDFNSNDAIVGTAATMKKEITEAVAKFTGFEDACKVVLLDFYGDQLSEEDIPPLLDRSAVQQIIDEIWMTKRDWISEDDYEIGFQRIFTWGRLT
jgi:hypothetical protein